MSKARVAIPINPRELIDLCLSIVGEHQKQGKSSPLNILKWEDINGSVSEADQADKKIAELYRELNKLTQRRKSLVENTQGLGDFARQSRDILSGVYRNEMKRLADFGFEVSDSPKVRKPAEKKVNGQQPVAQV